MPIVMVAVAIALTTSNLLRPDPLESPAWTKPDHQICDGLNAPVALVMYFLRQFADMLFFGEYRTLQVLLELGAYFLLVGLLWYAVCIEFGGRGLSVLSPKTRMRRTMDVLAVFFGAVLGVFGLLVREQSRVFALYWNLIAIPYYIWSVTIMIFYGHDLWFSLKRTPPKPSAVASPE